MSGEIDFSGRVALVTGAGGGLGRAYARLLAARGAQVVVNDLGGDSAGREVGGGDAADAVVAEIRAGGGAAAASHTSVADVAGAEAAVRTALDEFGRLDIVVNNAGILRDASFAKLTDADWNAVLAVHLHGTMNVCRAAWPHLRAGGYGRIVNTTSAAGLFGNFGQANYSAAKLGIVGLTRTLAVEGASKGITANVVAPGAASRLTEGLLPEEVAGRLDPDFVAPVVGYLVSEECTVTGQVFAAGGGYVSRVAVLEGRGVVFGQVPSLEDVRARYADIADLTGAVEPASGPESVEHMLKRVTEGA